jgi:hypothetical protein
MTKPDRTSDTTHIAIGGQRTVVAVVPTQVRRPWRATARTAFQALVAFAVLFPVLVETAGLDPAAFPWLAVPVAVAAGFARVMALPQVDAFLRRFLPFLSATGK